MLNAEKTKKTSIRRKQRFASMQTDYLYAILRKGCGAAVNKQAFTLLPWAMDD
jgi:hypothetical protein